VLLIYDSIHVLVTRNKTSHVTHSCWS